ncbi:MAG TPA: RagB/SusD family nutrient uptake outer membrane protein [Flavisolibacter sp.]|jgi:hypothetical protein|nr:RagB/SusD family nutrient uptake outer membrane protein [Flavisolibacter sp.]
MQQLVKKFTAAALLCATLAGMGCNKFVEETDPSNLTPGTYYTLPEHATAAIASVYSQTRFINGGAGIFVNNFQMIEAVTGTIKTETGQNSDLNNLLGLGYNGDNALVNNWWNGLYNVVAQANQVLDRVPGINPMDEAMRKRILGEAYFLRAWSYFYLVRLWGDVPLIVTSQTTSSPDFYPSRTPAADVYAKIVSDLQAAESAGLPMTDNTGRASTGAAKSLLAKVYLTMAGAPLNKGATHYRLAADKAAEVVNSNAYRLFDTYNELHDVANDNRGEHIFQIQYLVGVADNPNQAILLPNFKGVSAIGTEVGSMVPVLQFYNAFDPADKRKVDRAGFFFTSYYTEGSGALKDVSAPYIFKHFDVLCHGTAGKPGAGNSSLNWNQLRFADVLLTYAEAQNEADGSPNAAAINALTRVRTRAGLTTATTFSQAAFRTAVWKERWQELCYEGITWFDMIRLRKVYNPVTNAFDDFVGHRFPDNGATLAAKHLLFPLPTAEMQNNPNLKPQNPGY